MRSMGTDNGQGSWQLRKFVLRSALALLMVGTSRSKGRCAERSRSNSGIHILLTGTFYSQNWIRSQLGPLMQVNGIDKVTFVSATPVDEISGLEVIYPPKLLQRVIGSVPARLLTFVWRGIRYRPDVIGGYHLLVNGLVSLLTARLTRAKSLYICVGGPTEVLGGGYATENRIFGRLRQPDPKIEGQLISAVDAFDCVVVRGRSAKSFFEDQGVSTDIRIITAGVDSSVFTPTDTPAEFDLVFLARLSMVKRVEIFLQIVELLNQDMIRSVNALIIGDGPTREAAEEFIGQKRLGDHVRMVGQQDDVAAYLNRGKVFVLTSKSEGLSQAMVQAMLCGLPAVVANVGALSDLVEKDRSGYLIDEHGTAKSYVDPIKSLLGSSRKLAELSASARQSALRCSVESVAEKWDRLVAEVYGFDAGAVQRASTSL